MQIPSQPFPGPTSLRPRLGSSLIVAFHLDGESYGIELPLVDRVLPMVAVTPLPQGPAVALGVINIHGLVVPVLDVRRRFGLPDRSYGLSAHVLVARTGRRTVALPVDEVIGVIDVASDETALPAALFPGIGQVSGIVALRDGILCIQDLEAFLTTGEEEQLDRALDEQDP